MDVHARHAHVMNNSIELEFGDGSYTFALPLPQLAELQRKCDAGIGALHARVMKGCVQNPVTKDFHVLPALAEFYALDVIEPIRQGLIGGNHGVVNGQEIAVPPTLANKLVDAYVIGQPLIENWKIALAVLGACVMGYTPPKKASPAKERAPGKRRKKAGSTTTAP